MSRTWIAYNKPEEPSSVHAGLLLALGLHGFLRVLSVTDIYQYISQVYLVFNGLYQFLAPLILILMMMIYASIDEIISFKFLLKQLFSWHEFVAAAALSPFDSLLFFFCTYCC